MSRPSAGQEGFTLTEVLVALVLIGVGATAVVAALQVSISSSVWQRDLATAQVAIRQSAEEIRSADFDPCASGYDVTGTADNVDTSTTVEFWDGTDSRSPWTSVCPSPEDDVLQRVTLEVTVLRDITVGGEAEERETTRAIEIVKRR